MNDQFTLINTSGSLQIPLLVCSFLVLRSHKVSPTESMAKMTSKRLECNYLKKVTQKTSHCPKGISL
jgi:hypothetical protein